MITRINIDLETWTDHYPTGCALYSSSEYVDGQYCDTADEFIEFLSVYEEDIKRDRPEVIVTMNLLEFDNSTVIDCAKEIKKYLEKIMYGIDEEENNG